ncbi:MAG: hypothetical protein LBQ74_02800 [Prevotella sp.]|jgi:hypothetical protein|nr:hypothetical protein [Prevotella sp.]
MDQSTEQKVLEALYDRLFQAVTYAPAGQASLFDKTSVFIQFAKNQAINPKDFANPLSPVNPKGDLNSAEFFSRMVDAVPAIDSNYVITANKVSKTYGSIVRGADTKSIPDSNQLEIYTKAYSYLNKEVTIEDFEGNKTTSYQPSPVYAAYKNNRTAYMSALSAYRTAYLGYNMENLDDQRKWQANEPLLKNAISQTYDTWRAQGATQVEQALAAMASSINNIVSSTIKASQEDISSAEMASSMGIQDPWYLAYANPTNWYDENAGSFSQLKLESNNLTRTGDSSYSEYSAGGAASWGLWSVGADVSGGHKESHAHMDADAFSLSAEIAVVQINRPWLNDLIFRMKGWFLKLQAAGGISNGTLKDNSSNMLPLIPSAFIIARNIAITANWTSEDRSHVENSISTKARVGWGPFAVSGSYSHGSSSDYFHATFDGGTLKIPGMQIIGWVNQIVPYSAPLGDDNEK